MNVLVSGASGLVGSALLPALTAQDHSCKRLVRGSAQDSSAIPWNPRDGTLDPAALCGINAIVHLAGENIAGRWSARKKAEIRASRINGTRALCNAVLAQSAPPVVWISASAIGFYGDRGDEVLNESSAPGSGFLTEVCQEWERAAEPAAAKDVRVVFLRIGVVLSARGGALKKMLLPFKLGAGGVIGSGAQYWSWIALDDLVGIILYLLNDKNVSGPVNAVAPEPCTNREFTRTLARVLHRPAVFPMPAFAARLALGEMADALLLSSCRVLPERLLQTGYQYQFPTLEPALRHALK